MSYRAVKFQEAVLAADKSSEEDKMQRTVNAAKTALKQKMKLRLTYEVALYVADAVHRDALTIQVANESKQTVLVQQWDNMSRGQLSYFARNLILELRREDRDIHWRMQLGRQGWRG